MDFLIPFNLLTGASFVSIDTVKIVFKKTKGFSYEQ